MGNSKTAVVLLELGWPELGIAAMYRMTGQQVRYLEQKVWGSRLRGFLRGVGIEPIALEGSESIDKSLFSYGIASMAALHCIEKWNFSLPNCLDRIEHLDRVFLHDALRAAALGRFTAQQKNIFILDAWVRGNQQRTIVIVRSVWTSALLQETGIPVRTLRLPLVEALEQAWNSGASQIRRWCKRFTVAVRTSSLPDFDSTAPSATPSPAQLPSILLVFNNGLDYGPLFSYRYLLSDEVDSPLHKSRVGVLTLRGGDFGQGLQVHQLPQGDGLVGRLRMWLRLYRELRWSGREGCPAFVCVWVAGLLARSDFQAKYLRRTFPRARVAVLTYDIQIPPSLTIALHLAGIRSLAAHERPASAFDMSSSLIVEELLTASDFFSERAVASPSIAVRETTAVGMWRTDFLHEPQSLQTPSEFQRAQSKQQTLILALPYHLDHFDDQASHPVVSSAESLRHFIGGMIGIASRRSDAYVVIRGKDCEWLRDSRFADLVDHISHLSNLYVSTDYTTFGLSYHLALEASLIIAKPTSLADEALACGIPCLLHDYTHNSRGYAVNRLPYLPRELWCLDDNELAARVDAILDKQPPFQDWWGPIGAEIYGKLSDGHVRKRIRNIIETAEANMPASPPDVRETMQ